ncbi:hypothetical protein [Spiroplasma endosymbiont of Labia minor]|uniref:hypothetical protein n=1 Tax=Spiroplasma endosymbiont of Labia minor TaxID=3066305 RepID=UPI0030CDA854
MDIRGWSDTREQNFLNWCDFCQSKIMQKKNIASFNNQATTIYSDQILNIIKKNKSITVMNLFESLPNNLLINKNTKNELIALAKIGSIKIGSNINSLNENAQEYYLEFQTLKKETSQKEIIVKTNVEKVLDNQFEYDGPKHIFNNIEKIPTNVPVMRNGDALNNTKKSRPKANKNLINKLKDKLEIKHTINQTEYINDVNVKPIQMPVKEIPIVIEEKYDDPIITEKIVFKNLDVIDFVNSLELLEKYYILEFLKSAIKKEQNKLAIFNLQNEIIKNTNIQWEKERNNWRAPKPSTLKMFFYYLSYIILIGLLIPNPNKKNPIKKRAKIIWKENLKKSGNYEDAKNKILTKYNKLSEFI